MMGRYRKLPVEIEAIRFQPSEAVQEAPSWYIDAIRDNRIRFNAETNFTKQQAVVVTTEGDMLCNDGDWIIRGVEGELYPCKNSVFQATYEEVR